MIVLHLVVEFCFDNEIFAGFLRQTTLHLSSFEAKISGARIATPDDDELYRVLVCDRIGKE